MPELVDIAAAIIKITSNPRRDRFVPSRISEYLQANKFSSLDRRIISANVSNNLNTLRDYKIILRDPDNKQRRNRPWIIMDREKLRNYSNTEIKQDDAGEIISLFDSNILFSKIEKIEERLTAFELNILSAKSLDVSAKSNLDAVIRSTTAFETHFCPPYVQSRLDNIPVSVFHEVVKSCFKIIEFEAASSPISYTTHANEMPLVIFGRLATDRSMRQPRFGITSHTQVSELKLEHGLYIWLSRQVYERLPDVYFIESNHITSWRGQHFLLPTIPLAIKKDDGWFVRNLGGTDDAAKILRNLAQFSITDPEVIEQIDIQGPATPFTLNRD